MADLVTTDITFTPISYIYVLIDPTELRVRYVGQSTIPFQRVKAHMYPVETKRSKKGPWITQLRKNKLYPILKIIEVCPLVNGIERETFWIIHYRSIENDLLNSHTGGGTPTHRTEATKLKQSLSRTGIPKPKFSQEHIERLTLKNRNRAKTKEFLEMRKDRQSKLWNNPDYRAKMELAHKHRKSDSNVKTWNVITPQGEQLTITNLTRYTKEQNLPTCFLHKLAKRGTSLMGWECTHYPQTPSGWVYDETVTSS